MSATCPCSARACAIFAKEKSKSRLSDWADTNKSNQWPKIGNQRMAGVDGNVGYKKVGTEDKINTGRCGGLQLALPISSSAYAKKAPEWFMLKCLRDALLDEPLKNRIARTLSWSQKVGQCANRQHRCSRRRKRPFGNELDREPISRRMLWEVLMEIRAVPLFLNNMAKCGKNVEIIPRLCSNIVIFAVSIILIR